RARRRPITGGHLPAGWFRASCRLRRRRRHRRRPGRAGRRSPRPRPRRLSPDGRWLAFTASHPGSFDTTTLYVAPLGGGSWVRVTDGRSRVGRVVWSEDGRALYYVSDPGGGVNVWRRRFEPATGRTSGEPYRLTAFEGAQRPVPDDLDAVDIAVADGRLVLPVTETSSRIWTVTLDW